MSEHDEMLALAAMMLVEGDAHSAALKLYPNDTAKAIQIAGLWASKTPTGQWRNPIFGRIYEEQRQTKGASIRRGYLEEKLKNEAENAPMSKDRIAALEQLARLWRVYDSSDGPNSVVINLPGVVEVPKMSQEEVREQLLSQQAHLQSVSKLKH